MWLLRKTQYRAQKWGIPLRKRGFGHSDENWVQNDQLCEYKSSPDKLATIARGEPPCKKRSKIFGWILTLMAKMCNYYVQPSVEQNWGPKSEIQNRKFEIWNRKLESKIGRSRSEIGNWKSKLRSKIEIWNRKLRSKIWNWEQNSDVEMRANPPCKKCSKIFGWILTLMAKMCNYYVQPSIEQNWGQKSEIWNWGRGRKLSF